jgi:hypothetical protein
MAKFGKCKFNDLKKLQSKLNKFGQEEIQLFIESCAKELAARLLARVIRRTPVGDYPKESGKKGGTLRRGWTAGKNQSATAYVQSLTINKVGKVYVIEITNPVDYAVYVEFGHRTRNHKGWVQGKFMLTISEQEIETAAPKILERKLTNKLREVFG